MTKLYKLFWAAIFIVAQPCFASEDNYQKELAKIDRLLSVEIGKAKESITNLEESDDVLSDPERGQLLIRKAVYYIYTADYTNASNTLISAEGLVTSINDIASVYSYQMTNYLSVSNYRGALKAAKKQIKVIDHIVEPRNQLDAYMRMANFYFNLSANHSSQRYVNKALKLINNSGNLDHCFVKVLFIANALEIKNDTDLKKVSNETIDLCKAENNALGVSLAYRVLGQHSLDQNLLVEAGSALLKALEGSEKLQFLSVMRTNSSLLAITYHKEQKFDAAKKLALEVVSTPDDSQLNDAKRESYQILADIFSKSGNYKKAFEAATQAQKYQEIIYDEEKIKTLAYEAAKFDFEELEDFIQKNENTAYVSSGRELKQIDKELDLIYDNTILQYLLLLFGTTVFTSTYFAIGSYRRNRFNKLTGLLRHDAATKKSKDVFHDAMYRKNGFAVIALDINQLKDFNRILGHEHADWVITEISGAIKKFTRFKKAFGCYSGSGSFYVFLELQQHHDAIELAKKLVEHVNRCNTEESLKQFKMTVSVGVSSLMQRTSGINDAEIRRQADVALHVAKEYKSSEIISYKPSFDEADNEHTKQMRFVQFIDPKLMVRARRL